MLTPSSVNVLVPTQRKPSVGCAAGADEEEEEAGEARLEAHGRAAAG